MAVRKLTCHFQVYCVYVFYNFYDLSSVLFVFYAGHIALFLV